MSAPGFLSPTRLARGGPAAVLALVIPGLALANAGPPDFADPRRPAGAVGGQHRQQPGGAGRRRAADAAGLAVRGVLPRLLRASWRGEAGTAPPDAARQLARLRLRRRFRRPHRDQQPCHRRGVGDHRHLCRWRIASRQRDRARPQDRHCAAQGRSAGAARRGGMGRLGLGARGQLGARHRQPVRTREHGHRRHHLGRARATSTPGRSTISSRPTRRSTGAIPAVRCST